jgi:hypothetical protein
VVEDFRARLAEELADGPEPPLGDLVSGALRQGRRLRTIRKVKIVTSTLAATVVLVTGLVFGGQALTTHNGQTLPAASATPHLTISAPAPATADETYIAPWPQTQWPDDPAPVIKQPGGAKSATTMATMAYRLEELLPDGQVSNVKWDGNVTSEIRLDLDRGDGPGMVYASVSGNSGPLDCRTSKAAPTTCALGPFGARVEVVHNIGNCVESTVVEVDHGNGVIVQVALSTCLAWNGTTNPPGREVLTVPEATAIAADPSWGTRMSTALVTAAAHAFPNL